MKKFISLILLICTLSMCLASCASLKSFDRHLGRDYRTHTFDDDEIEDLAESFDIDVDDFGVKVVVQAKDRDKGYYAYIIKCKSRRKAKELASQLEDVADLLEKNYYYDVDVVAKGKYVLIGHEDVVDDALNK